MFAMTSLVGTPVVAAPARATRAVRSTKTVAMAKAAPKKGAKKGEKKSFGEWLLNAAVRDSGVIGAGYENELKNGQYKGSKKKK